MFGIGVIVVLGFVSPAKLSVRSWLTLDRFNSGQDGSVMGWYVCDFILLKHVSLMAADLCLTTLLGFNSKIRIYVIIEANNP